ncbi:DUF4175 family protein [Rubrivirga marina]|uniref:DUF4175 family protein n=1 Tax=Rubrivirga marina TaxID=1196024 RepID=A0A271J1B6_9BACT|nr:DUF4175 family protein [Rubrivirga marina]PAP76834.1 hypothetical protein BSZ37_10520 [Rubrivirga marina]
MTASPLVDSLRRRIRAARRRLTGAAVAHGALVTLGVVGAIAGLAVGAEAAVWLGVEFRTALFWMIVLALTGLVGALVLIPLLRGWGVLPGLDERSVVRRAGRDYPGADDRLATLLDLADGHDSGDDQQLHAAALDALGREVAQIPFERVHAFGPARNAARWALVPVALLVLGFALWPQPMTAAAGRLLAPGVYFAPPAPFQLVVDPGDAQVTRGAAFEVTARAVGRELPLTTTLEFGRNDERATEEVRIQAEGDVFQHTIEAVRADLRYRLEADGVRTPWYTVRAVDRPLVRGVRVAVIPPGYSGRSARQLPEGVGDATGLVGSAVRVQVQHGGPAPVEAWLSVAWEDGRSQRVPLRLSSEAALGQFRLRAAGTYTVHLRSADGLENTEPARYRLGVLSDGPPQIALVEGADGSLDGGARRLVFRVTDDFGFRGGRLVYRVTRGGGTSAPRALGLGVRTRPLDQDVAVDWRVPGARPGDTVEFYGQITDNDAAGGKTARTPLFTLRYPSMADRLDDFGARRDSTVDALEELQEDAEESGERFRRLREELRENVDPDWEDRRQVEELLRQQDALRDQAQQLREQMRQLGEQMQNEDLGSDDLQRQFDDMQRVLEELDTPEVRDALERLREAMEKLDLRDMLQQADEAAASEEELRRRLERSMELMKRLEAAVEMEEIARRAENLAETEEELARQTEALREQTEADRPDAERRAEEQRQDGERQDSEPRNGERQENPQNGQQPQRSERQTQAERERLAEEQRQAREDAEALQEQLDDLQEQLEDVRNAPQEAVEEMRQQMQQDGGLPQQMEENAQQLQQNRLQDAQEGQQNMSQQLRQMAGRMRQQSQQMQGQQRQVDQAALRRALEDVLTISRDQETLASDTGVLPNGSPALVPSARKQSELRDALRTVADTLQRVAQTVPSLGPRIEERAADGRREMDLAVTRLADRRSGPAAGHQRSAMTHLNELALLLADVLDQLQNQQNQSGQGGGGQGGGSGGMSPQQMQQLGRAQQQLNQRIQQMLNESAGERLSGEQGRRLRQMAEQQEAIRRQLERAVEGAGEGMNPNDRSALQRVGEEMRQSAEQMRRGGLDRRTAPRQQQILERLLQAEESVNQRGREQQREAQQAQQRPAPPASAPRPGRPADRVRGDLIRALESGYAPDYQELIKRYFERLQARTAGG